MRFKNIMITSSRSLSVKDDRLVLDECKELSFPLEDISSVLIDNTRVMITSYLMSCFAEHAITVYFCDRQHLPNAVLLPFAKHSRHLHMMRNQMRISRPLQKQLWQSIVKAKVVNQGICLELAHKEGSQVLLSMAEEVKSGDTGHVEAKAAACYFRCLFGKGFTRSQENLINAALNYGYAIIRGLIARTIVAYGFEPSIGIWHKSEVNQFNLADDLIEPFRPFVDLFVAYRLAGDERELDTEDRKDLYNLMNYNLELDGQKRIVRNVVELMVSSLSSSLENEKMNLLLPRLIALQEHTYE